MVIRIFNFVCSHQVNKEANVASTEQTMQFQVKIKKQKRTQKKRILIRDIFVIKKTRRDVITQSDGADIH